MAGTTVGGGWGEPTDDSAEETEGRGEVAALQTQLESLRRQLELLEGENQRLLRRMSSCTHCSKECVHHNSMTIKFRASLAQFDVSSGGTLQEDGQNDEFGADETAGPFRESSSIKHGIDPAKHGVQEVNGACNEPDECTKHGLTEGLTGCHLRTTHHHPKRYVALKVMYFGQRFYGFASEAQKEPTIESEIFKALDKTRLSAVNKVSLCYSRCGRTDKGVSSTGQVISLYLRSKVKDSGENLGSEQDSCDQEIDYVRVLNSVLPKDIRIMGWSAVSTNFHARFSCLCREYKYFFWRGSLDVTGMKSAAKRFIGVHDFRNFCKMDAVNVNNYTRQITSFEISPCSEISCEDELWAMTIKGSAFLWHQVRCMVAVLFMIGEGHEPPSVIDLLLDTDKTPRKPQYNMAPELPLVLRSCEFRDLKFTCTSDAMQVLRDDLRKTLHGYLLQAAIFREALDCLSVLGERGSLPEYCKKKRNHIPLMMRPTEPCSLLTGQGEKFCIVLLTSIILFFTSRISSVCSNPLHADCSSVNTSSYEERRAKLYRKSKNAS